MALNLVVSKRNPPEDEEEEEEEIDVVGTDDIDNTTVGNNIGDPQNNSQPTIELFSHHDFFALQLLYKEFANGALNTLNQHNGLTDKTQQQHSHQLEQYSAYPGQPVPPPHCTNHHSSSIDYAKVITTGIHVDSRVLQVSSSAEPTFDIVAKFSNAKPTIDERSAHLIHSTEPVSRDRSEQTNNAPTISIQSVEQKINDKVVSGNSDTPKSNAQTGLAVPEQKSDKPLSPVGISFIKTPPRKPPKASQSPKCITIHPPPAPSSPISSPTVSSTEAKEAPKSVDSKRSPVKTEVLPKKRKRAQTRKTEEIVEQQQKKQPSRESKRKSGQTSSSSARKSQKMKPKTKPPVGKSKSKRRTAVSSSDDLVSLDEQTTGKMSAQMPFFTYVNSEWRRMKAENSKLNRARIMKVLSTRWKRLSPQQRQSYKVEAQRLADSKTDMEVERSKPVSNKTATGGSGGAQNVSSEKEAPLSALERRRKKNRERMRLKRAEETEEERRRRLEKGKEAARKRRAAESKRLERKKEQQRAIRNGDSDHPRKKRPKTGKESQRQRKKT